MLIRPLAVFTAPVLVLTLYVEIISREPALSDRKVGSRIVQRAAQNDGGARIRKAEASHNGHQASENRKSHINNIGVRLEVPPGGRGSKLNWFPVTKPSTGILKSFGSVAMVILPDPGILGDANGVWSQ